MTDEEKTELLRLATKAVEARDIADGWATVNIYGATAERRAEIDMSYSMALARAREAASARDAYAAKVAASENESATNLQTGPQTGPSGGRLTH